MFRTIIPGLALIALTACQPVDANEEDRRTISVKGQGTVTTAPDIAYLNMSVQVRKLRLDSAQQEVGNVVQRFLGLTTSLGIERSLVQSTGAVIRPDYEWDKTTRTQKLVGYTSERQLQVEVKDLEQLGKLIEGAVNAGVNRVSPPRFDSTKRKELYREALALAAADARENASVLAETLDAKLGEALSVSAGNNYQPRPPQPMMRAEMAMSDAAPSETYNTGDIRFEATVSASFALEN
jgi:uncharacterized protein YggE